MNACLNWPFQGIACITIWLLNERQRDGGHFEVCSYSSLQKQNTVIL